MDELVSLKKLWEEKREELMQIEAKIQELENTKAAALNAASCLPKPRNNLDNDEYLRYGRQMILPEIGLKGQIKIANSSVLVVGAGGLGCPAAVYLAAAGIGKLGIVDYDEVELGNLHRQILHTEFTIGMQKCQSVKHAITRLNSKVNCIPYHLALDSTNAVDVINQYDIVLDATDNVATRYLLNDACVLAGKPLVSGSALRFEGQLTVYNYEGGPCYRCLYPTPPPPHTVTNCSDGGVLGAVPGVIGCLQAIEAVKIITSMPNPFSQKLLLFDALYGTFRVVKLRPKQSGCCACGSSPSVTHLIDYEQFCGAKATDKDSNLQLLSKEERISVQQYKELIDKGNIHVLVDVRPPVELDMCKLPNSYNLPITEIDKGNWLAHFKNYLQEVNSDGGKIPIYVICRQGNDSQKAVVKLKDKWNELCDVKDIAGGLKAWSTHVDNSFPVY